jgi:hypothetical protein
MSRFGAWMWKEWREHRAVLLGTFLAIPIAVVAAFFALGEHLEYEQVDLFPAIAVAIPFFAVGFDIFSREARRGTQAMILRTPGALGAALVAKLVLLLAAVGVALAIEEAARAALSAATGLPRPFRWVVVQHLANGEPVREWKAVRHDPLLGLPPSTLQALWVLLAGLWGTLASTWFTRGTGTSLLGLAWLGALTAPWIHLATSRGWFFQPHGSGHFPWIAGIAAVAVLAIIYGWLRSRRFLATGLAPAARGLTTTFAVFALAYAAAGTAYARWIDVTPDVPELSIDEGFLGSGGEHLFLNVHRGESWAVMHDGAAKGTPEIPWIVNVRTGAWRRLGDLGERVAIPRMFDRARTWWALPWLVVSADGFGSYSNELDERWYSGRDGTLRERVAREQGRSTVISLLRDTAAASTPVRDATGRRAWILLGRIEREGEVFPAGVPEAGPFATRSLHYSFPTGWALPRDHGGEDPAWTVVDATSGTVRRGAVGDRAVLGNRILDPRRGLAYREGRDDEDDDAPSREWRLADFEAQTLSPPLRGLKPATTLGVVATNAVLGAVPHSHAADEIELVLWDPTSDTLAPLIVENDPSPRLSEASPRFLARLPDERTLLRVFQGPRVRPERGRYDTFAREPIGRSAWLVVDPHARSARRVSEWSDSPSPYPRHEPIAFEPSGTLLVIEDYKRVVRFGPGPDDRTVVFPRPAAVGR